ncbi:uncharacterized protein LACBIDRAFT_336018 [Laccaria bicolor S238N-H82]|uniref:Predicted protein n=1 Tax=Laccaria bicolor (strain S238N-H82 / ATCC MYA-4686) TaxID=486041 RepID=B0E459_LACBS|nr:uncharacterized protein LACBIDRAFT_336018 [Laccaria bicolor S238N-H82]EDQ98372.1 predicted protein [Laccaria bicolor S238N-H82]|eukprot:XP_001890976.1 predicted protein [Laccaria bicolor S238N-H82]
MSVAVTPCAVDQRASILVVTTLDGFIGLTVAECWLRRDERDCVWICVQHLDQDNNSLHGINLFEGSAVGDVAFESIETAAVARGPFSASHICGVALVEKMAFHHRSHDAATDQSAPKVVPVTVDLHIIIPDLMPLRIHFRFPTNRQIAALSLSLMERVLASFTMYSELKEATTDSVYDKVFACLQTEWTYIGGLRVADVPYISVDKAVFSISPGSLFDVNSYARSAIATSSIASGLGIACDAWFLLRCNWADLQTFIARARDVYGSYFFFSLSARVPGLCMFISALSLMLFLELVAFDAWPESVITICSMVGVVMSLQFWFMARIGVWGEWLSAPAGALKPTMVIKNESIYHLLVSIVTNLLKTVD